jgi:citrate lyase alpha subunit
MTPELQEYWLEDETIIFHHHQRGADELPHRALKELLNLGIKYCLAPAPAYYSALHCYTSDTAPVLTHLAMSMSWTGYPENFGG